MFSAFSIIIGQDGVSPMTVKPVGDLGFIAVAYSTYFARVCRLLDFARVSWLCDGLHACSRIALDCRVAPVKWCALWKLRLDNPIRIRNSGCRYRVMALGLSGLISSERHDAVRVELWFVMGISLTVCVMRWTCA